MVKTIDQNANDVKRSKFVLCWQNEGAFSMPRAAKMPVLLDEVRSLNQADDGAERQQRIASAIGRLGILDQTSRSEKQWAALHKLEREFDWLPHGTTVAVNLENSQFITGLDHADVIQKFVAVYGTEAQGWMFDVGCPAVVGGLCRT
jgi:hypothetical protein